MFFLARCRQKLAGAIAVCLLLGLILMLMVGSAAANSPHVDVLQVDGAVTPMLARYIDRGISQAEEDGAEACIIELNTPGGLLYSTQEITNRMLDAEVPVVVYVNKWAGSAGTFITLAADVAAMAPGSRIGAAHPVSGGGEDISDTMDMKVTEDAVADVRSFAQMYGRNVAAAEATVRQALSFSAHEALGKEALSENYQEILGIESPYLDPPLVDIGAESIDELVEMLGEGVTLANGQPFSISPGATCHYIGMTAMEDFLYAISDPNIAYILLSIAMLGILIELSHPGLILPGVVGGISLLMAIYSLGVLGANYAGILLIVLAIGLFVAEIFTSSFGLLTGGGVVALVLGSLILFSGTPFEINPWLITGVVAFFALIFVFVIGAVVRGQHRRPVTGKEGLVGKPAVVRRVLDPTGMVLAKGELWNATSESGQIELGEEVIVTKIEGLKLRVRKK